MSQRRRSTKKPTRVLNTRKQVDEAEIHLEIRRDRELKEFREMLELRAFRGFLWRVMGRCGIFEGGFDASARIYFNAGKRDVGLFLLGEIMQSEPAAFVTMQQEAAQAEGLNDGQ